jgi:hypothetical protein
VHLQGLHLTGSSRSAMEYRGIGLVEPVEGSPRPEV